MKKRLTHVVLLVTLLVGSLLPSVADAKPPYCDTAYAGCRSDCADSWAGLFGVTLAGCWAGCEIGYLNCG